MHAKVLDHNDLPVITSLLSSNITSTGYYFDNDSALHDFILSGNYVRPNLNHSALKLLLSTFTKLVYQP